MSTPTHTHTPNSIYTLRQTGHTDRTLISKPENPSDRSFCFDVPVRRNAMWYKKHPRFIICYPESQFHWTLNCTLSMHQENVTPDIRSPPIYILHNTHEYQRSPNRIATQQQTHRIYTICISRVIVLPYQPLNAPIITHKLRRQTHTQRWVTHSEGQIGWSIFRSFS